MFTDLYARLWLRWRAKRVGIVDARDDARRQALRAKKEWEALKASRPR